MFSEATQPRPRAVPQPLLWIGLALISILIGLVIAALAAVTILYGVTLGIAFIATDLHHAVHLWRLLEWITGSTVFVLATIAAFVILAKETRRRKPA